MCPPLPLNPDGTLNSSTSYRPQIECQTLRLPKILATSPAHDDSPSSSSLAHPPVAGPLSPRGVKARRLPSRYVAATLPESPRPGHGGDSSRRRCASNISDLYRKCSHHEVSAEPGGAPCRSVIMEYLECTAGER